MPLARVKELLAAGPARFDAAIAEIDRQLQQRIEALLHTRERLAQLRAGDQLFVSAEVADYPDRLSALGVSQRTVQWERDLWILMQAVAPKEVAIWIADKRDALDDPEFRAIYVACDAAFDWSPDDRRLPALAERMRRWSADRSAGGSGRQVEAPAIALLARQAGGVSSPAWDRLTELARQRQVGG